MCSRWRGGGRCCCLGSRGGAEEGRGDGPSAEARRREGEMGLRPFVSRGGAEEEKGFGPSARCFTLRRKGAKRSTPGRRPSLIPDDGHGLALWRKACGAFGSFRLFAPSRPFDAAQDRLCVKHSCRRDGKGGWSQGPESRRSIRRCKGRVFDAIP